VETPTTPPPPRRRLNLAHLIGCFGIWGLLTVIPVTVIVWHNRIMRAVLLMAWGLILLWVVLGGLLMWRFRDPIRVRVLRLPIGWRVKFVLFCTLLALIEEAITTAMTNLAPLFGAKIGEAYITASTNYLDVAALHSVIAFVPMFIFWAWWLSRYDFHPNAVFVLFGLTGTLAEAMGFGLQNLLQAGFWVFVYGLMVYLPAYSLPRERGAKPPRWHHYPLAVLLAPLCVAPVAIVIHLLHPVQIHFPPIRP
jgi:hypothetical protein